MLAAIHVDDRPRQERLTRQVGDGASYCAFCLVAIILWCVDRIPGLSKKIYLRSFRHTEVFVCDRLKIAVSSWLSPNRQRKLKCNP
jgi:hypothetical protein